MSFSLHQLQRGIFLIACLSLIAMKSFSQARAQADVSITSLTLAEVKTKTIVPNTSATNVNDPAKKAVLMANDLKCIITVHNENDDDAYETKLVVVLPVEVSVSNLPANATVYTASPNSTFVGYVMVNLGHMYVGQNITIEFNFKKSQYGNKVGAYAFSASPDPNPTNNYKEAIF